MPQRREVRATDGSRACPGLTVHDLVLLPVERCARVLREPPPSSAAGRGDRPAAHRHPRAVLLPRRGRARLSHARPPVAHAVGRRSAAHQPHHRARHLAHQHAVRAGRALDRAAPARHGPRDRRHEEAARARATRWWWSSTIPQIMLAADRILDLGPGPGERGGEIVLLRHAGGAEALRARSPPTTSPGASAPTAALAPQRAGREDRRARRRSAAPPSTTSRTSTSRIPLERLVCITGVSGSGKSTLVQDVLYAALLKAKGKPTEAPGRHRALKGHERIGEVVMVDQSPIGRTTRSNPASYVGAFDAIRQLFAAAPAARERRYTAGTFSFNSGNGRCPACSGNGFEHVEMQFLSDVYLRCPDCNGRRYRPEVLEVKLEPAAGTSGTERPSPTCSTDRHRGARVLSRRSRNVQRALKPLADVGLDYLRLGQPVPTLSGGEAQRLKLAGHLAEAAATGARQRRPSVVTVPVRRADHRPALRRRRETAAAFRQLLAAGHSLVVIEHNLDVIRAADWIIDLGPEGGDAGGEIVCTGTPGEVAAHRPRTPGGRCATTRRRSPAARARAASARTGARQPAAGRPAPARPQRHHDPRRARAQPQEHRRRRSRATASPW